jgi:hypothetical protein
MTDLARAAQAVNDRAKWINDEQALVRDVEMMALRAALAAQQAALDTRKSGPTGTESEVCADITRRQLFGISKYGTTVRDNPLTLRQWLQHAYEECLDQAVYLKRAMEEMDHSQEELKHLDDEVGP